MVKLRVSYERAEELEAILNAIRRAPMHLTQVKIRSGAPYCRAYVDIILLNQ